MQVLFPLQLSIFYFWKSAYWFYYYEYHINRLRKLRNWNAIEKERVRYKNQTLWVQYYGCDIKLDLTGLGIHSIQDLENIEIQNDISILVLDKNRNLKLRKD